MSLGKYFIIMSIATALAWVGWAIVLIQVNPIAAGLDGFFFFYLSLFLSLVGTFSILGLAIRMHTQQHHISYYLVLLSFRQGIFFAVLVVAVLILQSQRFLRWWNALLLIAVLTLVEYIALSFRQRRGRHNPH